MTENFCVQLENNIVVQSLVGFAEWASSRLGGEWVDTDGSVSIGWTYSEEFGFRPPKTFDSWVWENGDWVAPVAHPNDGGFYVWDEESQSWATVTPISDQGDS